MRRNAGEYGVEQLLGGRGQCAGGADPGCRDSGDTDAEHDLGDDAESGQPRQDGTQSAPTLWRGHCDRDLRWAVHGRRVGEHPQVEAIR